MTIPESQLEAWSHQGGTTGANIAYGSIKTALTSTTSPVRDKEMEVYLQGSYKNDTNIRADSDVDVILELKSTFHYDVSALPQAEETLYHEAYPNATYCWSDFRTDVLRALRAYYGAASIIEGNKSVKVPSDGNRVSADVIVSLNHKKYDRFRGLSDQGLVEGIAFKSLREGRWIVNFPKLHYENCVAKNSSRATVGWFKPTVRLFKNARKYLADKGAIPATLAPSYFLESLIYNAPDGLFGGSYQNTFCEVVNWLLQADYSQFICPNQQVQLFGEAEEQWLSDDAKTLVSSLVNLWNTWR